MAEDGGTRFAMAIQACNSGRYDSQCKTVDDDQLRVNDCHDSPYLLKANR